VIGGVSYFFFAFVPVFVAYAASLLGPEMVREHLHKDTQHILPILMLGHTPLLAQIAYFGALLSAIMSTASGKLPAPSVTFTENVLKRLLAKELSDRPLLWTMRAVVAGFVVPVTRAGASVPLVFGLYWKRAASAGALPSIVFGLGTWLALELHVPKGLVPPQLAGLVAAVAWMVVGSLATWRPPEVA
jgi:Na+/proline symporter